MTAQESEELDRIERRILAAVEKSSPYPPRVLLDELRGEGFDENLTRAAIWFLVDARRLDFSPHRELIIVKSTNAGSGSAG